MYPLGSILSEAAIEAAKLAAEKAATTAAKQAAEEAAQAAAKKAALEAAQTAAKKAVMKQVQAAAELAAKDAGRETSVSAAKKAAQFALKNPKLVIGGLTAAAAAGLAARRVSAVEGKKLNITKIERLDSATVKISYMPALQLMVTDKVDVAGSNSTPNINGTLWPIASIISRTQLTMKVPTTSGGTTGQMTVHTTFEGQLAGVAVQAGTAVVSTAASTAGNALTQAFPSIGEILGQYTDYAIAGAAVVAVVGVLLLAIKLKQTFGRPATA